MVRVPRIIYRHNSVERFIVSAIGEPGEREFFIQARSGEGLNTVKVEKEQVRALVARFDEIVTDLRRSKKIAITKKEIDENLDMQPLELPIEADFQVGIVGIKMNDLLLEVTFQAISNQDELLIDDMDSGPDLLILNLDVLAVGIFSARAKIVIDAGRSTCPFCALPMNSSGHLCPRANGYRR